MSRGVSAMRAGVEGVIFENSQADRLRISKNCARAALETDMRLFKRHAAVQEDCAYASHPRLLRALVPLGTDGSDMRVAHAAEPRQAALREERRAVREDAHSETSHLRPRVNPEIKNTLRRIDPLGPGFRRYLDQFLRHRTDSAPPFLRAKTPTSTQDARSIADRRGRPIDERRLF